MTSVMGKRSTSDTFSLDYGIEQLINAYQMTLVYNNRNFTNLWANADTYKHLVN